MNPPEAGLGATAVAALLAFIVLCLVVGGIGAAAALEWVLSWLVEAIK